MQLSNLLTKFIEHEGSMSQRQGGSILREVRPVHPISISLIKIGPFKNFSKFVW